MLPLLTPTAASMAEGDARPNGEAAEAAAASASLKKPWRGVLLWLWQSIFGRRSQDFERRLQYLAKQEDAVHARMNRRLLISKRVTRDLIALSVILEVLAVVYAVSFTRSEDLNWRTRAIRVLPVIVLPGLFSVIYSTLASCSRMFDRRDKKILERLRAERKAKIDELKERTNYYATQQLIEKYDLDPSSKAAAASVLFSKLGADSGLNIAVGDEPAMKATPVEQSSVEPMQSTGLRNRKKSHARSIGTKSFAIPEASCATPDELAIVGHSNPSQTQLVVEHYKGSVSVGSGWFARTVYLLVGEDTSESCALICGNCHRHNGLARKEDFAHLRYFCPQCHALNTSLERGGLESSLVEAGVWPT